MIRKPNFDGICRALDAYHQGPEILPEEYVKPEKPKWLYDFCVDICEHDKLDPQPHYEICSFAENLVGDCMFSSTVEKEAALVFVPRDNFKTTIFAQDLLIGALTKNPNLRAFIATHTMSLSEDRLKAIKGVLKKGERFKEVYGEDWAPQRGEGEWSAQAIEVTKRTKAFKEPSITVGSVGTGITGSHFNIIVADDLVHPKNVKTAEGREEVFSYISNLFPLLEPGGLLLILGTRWHPDDAYGRILSIDEERKKSGKSELYSKFIRSCYDGPNGLYFPSRYPHEALDDLKDRLTASHFAANYLNKPIADSEVVFKPEYKVEKDFGYFITQDRNNGLVISDDQKIPVDVTMAWDTAGSRSSAKSDFHGLSVVGVDSLGREWQLVAEEKKGTVSEVVSRVVAHVITYRPRFLIIESIGAYELWRSEVESELNRFNCFVAFVESKHGGVRKEERIAMLEPKWSSRRMIIKKEQSAFQKQLGDFSMSNNLTHDDILDARAMHEGYMSIPEGSILEMEANPIDEEYIKRENRRGSRPSVFDRIRGRRLPYR